MASPAGTRCHRSRRAAFLTCLPLPEGRRPPTATYPVGTEDEGDPLAGALRRLQGVGSGGQRLFVQVLGAARGQQQAGPVGVVHLHGVVPVQHHQPFRGHGPGLRGGSRRRGAGRSGAERAAEQRPPSPGTPCGIPLCCHGGSAGARVRSKAGRCNCCLFIVSPDLLLHRVCCGLSARVFAQPG